MSYFRYIHKCTVKSRIKTTNAAGQRVASWSSIRYLDAPCWYSTRSGAVRAAPVVEYQETISLIVPAEIEVSEYDRIYDIKDRDGNILDAGPFEVVSTLTKTNFYGRKHHTCLIIRHVMDNA